MSATTYGWLVLAFPLAGTIVIALGWQGAAAAAAPAGSRSGAIFARVPSARSLMLLELQDQPEEQRQLVDALCTYAATGDFNVDLGDPGRPAVGVHVPGGDRACRS